MNIGEWIAAGVGLIAIGGFLFAGWNDGRQIKQALLGYQGKGGMMTDLESVKIDLQALRSGIGAMREELRSEIQDSRHMLREELEAKIDDRATRIEEEIASLDNRVRDLELRKIA